jgi:hypothetical protein
MKGSFPASFYDKRFFKIKFILVHQGGTSKECMAIFAD